MGNVSQYITTEPLNQCQKSGSKLLKWHWLQALADFSYPFQLFFMVSYTGNDKWKSSSYTVAGLGGLAIQAHYMRTLTINHLCLWLIVALFKKLMFVHCSHVQKISTLAVKLFLSI